MLVTKKLKQIELANYKTLVFFPLSRFVFFLYCSKNEQECTPFAVHYEKIRIRSRETATDSAEIHSLTRKNEHLRINQIQF